MCENQGVQGTDSYLDMEGLRKATNGIGAWGVNLFVLHAFNYDASRANYPPDWLHQPYWPYFHYYADYTRRLSYMNSESRHAANVLLYYPILSMWANSDPVFSANTPYDQIGQPEVWKNLTITINDYYTRLILRLADRQWDYNIADDDYLERARIEGKELGDRPAAFSGHHSSAHQHAQPTRPSRRSRSFIRRAATVLGIRMLPASSPESGRARRGTEKGIADLFGAGATEHPPAFHSSSKTPRWPRLLRLPQTLRP